MKMPGPQAASPAMPVYSARVRRYFGWQATCTTLLGGEIINISLTLKWCEPF